MKIGSTTISDLKVGSAAVQKVYLGSQVVWMPPAVGEVTGSYLGNVFSPAAGAASAVLTDTFTLPVGRVFIIFAGVRADQPTTVTVGGAAATAITGQLGSGNKRLEMFEYENLSAGDKVVNVTATSDSTLLETIFHVYVVTNATVATVVATTMPQSSLADECILFSSMQENAAVAIPDATVALTTHYNADIRTQENHFVGSLNGATTLSDPGTWGTPAYATLIVG